MLKFRRSPSTHTRLTLAGIATWWQARGSEPSADASRAHSHRLEALGRLTGGVAHDFNNLLGVISNSAHLMLRQTQDPTLTASLETTLRAVSAGSRLTRHLLRFSERNDSPAVVIQLDAFIEEVADLLRAVMGRHIALTVDLDPAAPTAWADPHGLELSLINLALNARDAIGGSGRVVLRTARADEWDRGDLAAQVCVVVSITDDGSGEAGREGAHPPGGPGMDQVQDFCRQAGGAVRVDSTPGLGTTVSIVLRVDGAQVSPAG